MVHFEIPRRVFRVNVQRDTQPYPSSDVAVWKTGQGREKPTVEKSTRFDHKART